MCVIQVWKYILILVKDGKMLQLVLLLEENEEENN